MDRLALTDGDLGWNCYLSFLNSQPSGPHIDNPTYPPDV